MTKLGVASKLNADWGFLTHLRDIGRDCADAWLKTNFDRIGLEFDGGSAPNRVPGPPMKDTVTILRCPLVG